MCSHPLPDNPGTAHDAGGRAARAPAWREDPLVASMPPAPQPERFPLVTLAILFLVAAALSLARAVLIPIALAILLSFILAPLVLMLQRRRVPRNAAVILVSLGAFVVIGGLVAVISLQLRDLARDLPAHEGNITRKLRDLGGEGPGILGNLLGLAEEVSEELGPKQQEQTIAIPVQVRERRATGLEVFPVIAPPLLGVLASAFLVVALTVSMLFTREELRNRVLRLVGHAQLASTTRAMDEAGRLISRYLLMQVVINSAFGAVFGLGLFLIGVPYSFLWGFFAAVFRFVPYVGTWAGGVLPLLVSLAVFEGWPEPILV
ncbi:MAG TPA: AI-2E family transporter, partial [Gemmataceae bacterium]